MIQLVPFTSNAALQVFRHLDHSDYAEACDVRGGNVHYLDLFADWVVHQRGAPLSVVLFTPGDGGKPFAVLALSDTGQAGVAQAALLARSHTDFRRSLAKAASLIRSKLPDFCDEAGIFRIEARCSSTHPTASRFLSHCGFRQEAKMAGFGVGRPVPFCQFAWIHPNHIEGD